MFLMTKFQDMVPAADPQLKTIQVKNPTGSGFLSSAWAWATLSAFGAIKESIPYVAEIALVSSLLSNTEEAAMQQLRYLTGGSEFGPFAHSVATCLQNMVIGRANVFERTEYYDDRHTSIPLKFITLVPILALCAASRFLS
ncbi:unnamed protein product [Penicillium pancosmium]